MALVKDRLLAVAKDREAMQRKAQDAARAEGKTSDEVMVSTFDTFSEKLQ